MPISLTKLTMGGLVAITFAAQVSGFASPVRFANVVGGLGRQSGISRAGDSFCGSTRSLLVTGPLPCRASAAVGLKATATAISSGKYMIIESAPKCAFLANTWKTQAEGARALGWTQSSEQPDPTQEMLKLQRVSYTADLLAKAVPLLLAKASAEKAAVENGGSATNVPDIIKNMRVAAAVSAGDGSACAMWTVVGEGESKCYTIDRMFANTQLAGGDRAQTRVMQHVAEQAAKEGVKDIRLQEATFKTLCLSPGDLGFGPEVEGEGYCPYLF